MQQTKPKIKKYAMNFAVLCVTVIVCILLIEATLALVSPQKRTVKIIEPGASDNFDSVVGWTGYKNRIYQVRTVEFDTTVSINEEGFYDDKWALEKPPNTRRIIALGDSMTQGEQVDRNERFTDLLEETPAVGGGNVEILNFGMGAYSTCNEFFVLKDKAMKYDPDGVILFFYVGNDFDENLDKSPHRPGCEFDSDGELTKASKPVNTKREKSMLAGLILKTHLGQLAMNSVRYSPISYKISKNLGQEPRYKVVDLFEKDKTKELSERMQTTFLLLKGTDRFLKKKDVEFLVVIIPHRIQVQNNTWDQITTKYNYKPEDYDLRLPNALLTDYLDENDIKYIDLYAEFRQVIHDTGNDLYLYHDGHLNEQGHTVVAATLYTKMQSLKTQS